MGNMEYGDPEKHAVEKSSDTESEYARDREAEAAAAADGIYAREELVDPDKDKTLHRGLSARQIQMIAVRPFACVPSTVEAEAARSSEARWGQV